MCIEHANPGPVFPNRFPSVHYVRTPADDRREYQAQVNVFASAARAAARQEGAVKNVRALGGFVEALLTQFAIFQSD